MKKMQKWLVLSALAWPMMAAGSCAAGLREALIEGGFAFVEESAVSILHTAVPIEHFLESAEHAVEQIGEQVTEALTGGEHTEEAGH